MKRKSNIFQAMFLGIFIIPLIMAFMPQEAGVHQRKIDRDRELKEKKARKSYEKAVKQHNDNQSKETKAMMRQAKKSKPRNTPLRHSSGTKCK